MILYAPFTDEVTSYEEALEKFADFLQLRNYSPRTVVRYQQDLEKMIRFLRDVRNIQSLDDVTKKDLFEYETEVYSSLRIRDKQPLSQDSKVGRIVAMKSFFNFLSIREMIPYNPAEHISIPTVNRHKLRDVYSEEEIINMLEAAKGETPLEIRDRAMMELLYSTAIRPDEMIHVATKDLDIEKAELKIRFGKGRMGKHKGSVPEN